MAQMQTGHPNIKTIFSQSEQRMDAEFNTRSGLLEIKLHQLSSFLTRSGDPYYLWGKPAHFDCPKIESLLTSFNYDMPVPWYNYRCMSGVRTAAQVIGTQRPKFHTKGNQDHHALWDAMEQTLELQGWLRNMRSGLRV
jgi:hypothetical protein